MTPEPTSAESRSTTVEIPGGGVASANIEFDTVGHLSHFAVADNERSIADGGTGDLFVQGIFVGTEAVDPLVLLNVPTKTDGVPVSYFNELNFADIFHFDASRPVRCLSIVLKNPTPNTVRCVVTGYMRAPSKASS